MQVYLLTVDEWIGGHFLTNCCLWTMARQNHRIVGELRDGAQALDEHEHRSAIQICTTYGALEQGIAGKAHLFVFTIVEHSAT